MPSEAVDFDVGQFVGRGLKDVAIIMDLHELATLLLVLLGFFPIVVLVGVGAIFLATLWMASS